MSIPHWEDSPEEWNRLELGGNVMPGVWDIDFPSTRNMDVKKAKGKDGARFKDEGYDPARIELTGRLVRRADFAKLVEIVDQINPKKGGKRNAYGIDHPKARFLGITLVYIVELRAPKVDRGILTMTIRALEYVDKPPAVKAPKGPPVTLADEFNEGDGLTQSVPDGPDALSKEP